MLIEFQRKQFVCHAIFFQHSLGSIRCIVLQIFRFSPSKATSVQNEQTVARENFIPPNFVP